MVIQARPAFAHFGLSFLTSTRWDPVHVHYGVARLSRGHARDDAHRHGDRRPHRTRLRLGARLRRPHARSGLSSGPRSSCWPPCPSVVYGLWGLLVVAPWVRTIIEPALAHITGGHGPFSGPQLGVGLLLAGVILSIMVLPTMVAISRDVLMAVPQVEIEGAFALGATRWQVMRRVVVPSARGGILGATTLATGRALGETIAVTMVIGNTDHFTHSLFGTTADDGVAHRQRVQRSNRAFSPGSLIAVGVVLLVVAVIVNLAARLARPFGRPSASHRDRGPMTIMAVDPVLARRAEIQRIAEATDHRRQLLSRLALLACRACLVITLIPLVGPSGLRRDPGGLGVDWALLLAPAHAGRDPRWWDLERHRGIAHHRRHRRGGAIPFGIAAGLFLAESDGRIAGTMRLAADVLSGVPSIVVAIFAYAVLVAHGIGHFSAMAASFAIGILMLPVIMRASETAIRGVPTVPSEAGLALGAEGDDRPPGRAARGACPA